MYKTAINGGSVYLSFALLGFITKDAFFNICLSVDKSIAFWQLDAFWTHGILAEGLENKIYNILEQIKHE